MGAISIFLLTMQRYNILIAVLEYIVRNFIIFFSENVAAAAVLTSSTTAGARHSSSSLGSALTVAVLQLKNGKAKAEKYIYNIYIIVLF